MKEFKWVEKMKGCGTWGSHWLKKNPEKEDKVKYDNE